MATTITNEALEWIVSKTKNESGVTSEIIYDVAVGSGSAAVDSANTQLDVQEFRGNLDDSTITIENTSPALGELQVTITINGGTEVPADTEITELGVFARDPSIPDGNFENGNEITNDADDILIYRELRPGIIIESGDQKTFQFEINVTR